MIFEDSSVKIQEDGFNCGVYCCMTAELFARNGKKNDLKKLRNKGSQLRVVMLGELQMHQGNTTASLARSGQTQANQARVKRHRRNIRKTQPKNKKLRPKPIDLTGDDDKKQTKRRLKEATRLVKKALDVKYKRKSVSVLAAVKQKKKQQQQKKKKPVYTAAMEDRFDRKPGDKQFPKGKKEFKNTGLQEQLGTKSNRFFRLPDGEPYHSAVVPRGDIDGFLELERQWLEGKLSWKKLVPILPQSKADLMELPKPFKRVHCNKDDSAMFAKHGETVENRAHLNMLPAGEPYWNALVPTREFFTRHEKKRGDDKNYWKRFSRPNNK